MAHVSGYDAFAPIYDAFAAAMTEDVPFYVELAAAARGPVVELAVGTGRVAIPIDRADRPPRDRHRRVRRDARGGARRHAADAGIELELRQGDMSELALDEPTDLVICPFRAMLHLPGHDARVAVMRRVRAALVPGGRFAWNAFVFDPAIADGDRRRLARRGAASGTARRTTSRSGGSTSSWRAARGVPLWWVDRDEWEESITEAGLEIEALYGWFDRRPLNNTSREFVYVARRPA